MLKCPEQKLRRAQLSKPVSFKTGDPWTDGAKAQLMGASRHNPYRGESGDSWEDGWIAAESGEDMSHLFDAAFLKPFRPYCGAD